MAQEEYGGPISPYRGEAIAALESLDEPDEPAGEPTAEDEEPSIESEADRT